MACPGQLIWLIHAKFMPEIFNQWANLPHKTIMVLDLPQMTELIGVVFDQIKHDHKLFHVFIIIRMVLIINGI